MEIVNMLSVFCGVLVLFCIALLIALLKSSGRILEMNKQLMIIVAGKEPKPESALKALVALNRPSQGKLKGIADEKKEDKKSTNTDYQVKIEV